MNLNFSYCKKTMRIIFAISISLLLSLATAGSIPGPLVILFDLSKDKELKKIIEDQSNSKALECRRPDVELFIDRRPSGLLDELVIDGVVKKNKVAMRKLNKILHMPDDDIDKGYDGIVVYISNPKPRFITFVTGYSATLDTAVSRQGNDEFIKTLCMVLPPITRKP